MMPSSCLGPVAAWRSRRAAVIYLRYAHRMLAIIIPALCLLLSGCATSGLDPSYQVKATDAIIVLGTEGASQATITPGRSDGTTWRFLTGFKNRHIVNVRDGFVVVRLDATSPNTRYGVYQINNTVVQSANIATFAAEEGTVTYIGTLAFNTEEIETTSGWRTGRVMRKKWNPDGAAEFLRKNYPELAPKLRCLPAIEFQKNKFVIF
jgi:hypothetical protein